MTKMRELPVNDFEMKNVPIRADGQVMRPLYAARIKAPAESKYPYDYYEIVCHRGGRRRLAAGLRERLRLAEDPVRGLNGRWRLASIVVSTGGGRRTCVRQKAW